MIALSEPSISGLLAHYSEDVAELTLHACELIRRILPGASEKVNLGWKNISFGTGPGMDEQVFSVGPQRAHVNIYLSGADLLDPAGLLSGTGKRMRHVKIRTAAELDDPALHELLRAAQAAHATSGDLRRAAAGPPAAGYRAYASKTVAVPLRTLLTAWTDPSLRDRWLQVPGLEVRGPGTGKSVRGRWSDGTRWEARFVAKGDARSQVSVDHGRIGSEAEAIQIRATWKAALDGLKRVLEA